MESLAGSRPASGRAHEERGWSVKVREIPIEDSAGLTLAYDLTGITPGRSKGAVFRRGHVFVAGDLDVLREIGKSSIKILELDPDEVHEDDAARELALSIAGNGIEVVMPGEAWADLVASREGLLKVDRERLTRLNQLDGVLIASRHDDSPVREGETLARAKVRELSVRRAVLDEARSMADGPVAALQVLPYRRLAGAAVITGREVYEGLKKDAFEPLLRRRLEEYGGSLDRVEIVPDDTADISRAISTALGAEAEIVFVTGGGSPDDSTSEAVGRIADEVVFHGVPVAPGAMSILAYSGDVPILGVPAGLLARPRGFIDLILPRILIGDKPTKVEIAAYGYGGLCLRCPTCVFPACPFGRR